MRSPPRRAAAGPPAAGCSRCRTRRPGSSRTAAPRARTAGCAASSTPTSAPGPGSLSAAAGRPAGLGGLAPYSASWMSFLLLKGGPGGGAELDFAAGQVNEGVFQRRLLGGELENGDPGGGGCRADL